MNEQATKIGAMLYLVGTPIGTLTDLSPRAAETLCSVDLIYAEDTRHSAKICEYVGARAPMQSYHEHNKAEVGPRIVASLKNGKSVALITDAGMPAISDPGADLVTLCIAADIPITTIPGPTALITALALSGMPTDRFVFEGFLPVEKKAYLPRLSALQGEERTMIFYEAPHRLSATLAHLAETFGETRGIAVCRELTKRNEEILRTTIAGAIAHFTQTPPRGEFVLVLAGRDPQAAKGEAGWQQMTIAEHVAYYMEAGLSKMDAMKQAAKDRGVGKSEIYKAML